MDLAIGLMRAVMPLAERAARLPAGPSNPDCNAGMSFITLRDAGALPREPRRAAFSRSASQQLSEAGATLAAGGDARAGAAAAQLLRLASAPPRGFELHRGRAAGRRGARRCPRQAPPRHRRRRRCDGVENIAGAKLELIYEGQRCIHSRFCVTGAPQVFLANVKGPWIHPDAMPVERWSRSRTPAPRARSATGGAMGSRRRARRR